MSDQDRIRLAEAMGAKCIDGMWHWKGSTWDSLLFDPFADANDDYAVLKYFERGAMVDPAEWERFKDYWRDVRGEWNVWNYERGDYARAALAALKESSDE